MSQASSLVINPDLRSLIPALTAEEFNQLEANLVTDGCHAPLIVWQETQTLLDGHNRLEICTRHGLAYRLSEISLDSLDAAKAWMIANQLGRRNLTPEQMSYYRGEQYNLQKRQGKRTDITSDQSEQKSQTTAERLADQHHVSAPTIRRDGAYAGGIEVLAQVLGPEVRQAILAGELPLTREDIRVLSGLLASNLDNQAVAHEAQRDGTLPATLQAMARAARCAICHRPLSDPASVSRGIGPICTGHSNGAPSTRSGPGGGGAAAAHGHAPLVLEPEVSGADDTPVPSTWPQTVATGDVEWYTPPEILDRVRQVLETIDVDPASCTAAQAVVQATTYYTIEDDGLRQPWHGRVFCNPPYKLPEIARFCGKLIEERAAEHTTEAILLVNAATETDWFQRIAAKAEAICFPDGRSRFRHATHDGLSPCSGQALLYFGPQCARFCAIFSELGLLVAVVTQGPELNLFAAPVSSTPQEETCITREEAGSLIQAVYQTVQHLHSCTNAQAAKALGEPPKRTHQALQSLIKQGKVRKEGQAYSVVEAR